jgi:LysR family transcriptional regulator for metE and metH
VLDGALDLAIVSSSVRHRQLAVLPLFHDEHVLVVAPDHPLARQPFVRLKDFRNQRLLTYAPRDESHFSTRVLQPAGVRPAAIEPVQLTEATIEMVRAGLGVAVLARWVAEPFVGRGALRALRITTRGYVKEWRAVVPRRLAQADHVREFVRLVVAASPTARAAALLPFAGRKPVGAAG